MSVVVDIIAPVFGLLAFGYAATFTKVFDQAAGKGLAAFVFWFAIPVMLFRNVAGQAMPETIPWGYLLSYYLGTFAVFAAAGLLAGPLFRTSVEERVLLGFGSAYGNIVLLGTPLALAAFGPPATLPFFLILSVHSVIMMTLVSLVIEVCRGRDAGWAKMPGKVIGGILRNPIPMSLMAGLLFHKLGLVLPKAVDQWAAMIGAAAGPCALFSLGASLRAYRITGALPRAGFMILMKMLVHPALVWVLATFVFAVPPLWTGVAVLTASLPVGVNSYLFAERYRVGQAEAAAAILIATVLSVATVTVLLGLLGVGVS
ncbi:MAG: AEC family transporter [Geminicoccaceae bacterium]